MSDDGLWDWGDDGRPAHQIAYAEKLAAQREHMEKRLAELDTNFAIQQQLVHDFEAEANKAIGTIKADTAHEVVWIGYLPSAWKTEIKAMIGKPINKVYAFRLKNEIKIGLEWWKANLIDGLCVLRLTKNQAMMAKLTDRGKLWKMLDDPHGMIWSYIDTSIRAIRSDILEYSTIDDFVIAINNYYVMGEAHFITSPNLIATKRLNANEDNHLRQRARIVESIEKMAERTVNQS